MLDNLVRQAFANGLRKGYLGERLWGDPLFHEHEFFEWLFKAFVIFLKVPTNRNDWNARYADTYLFGEQSRGGFEIVKITIDGEERTFMRLYAGAVLGEESLAKLGITAEDVIDFLKRVLLEAGDKTRLDQSYQRLDRNWQYSYQVVDDLEFDSEIFGLPLLRGSERILFLASDASWHRVLKHNFIFVEVK
ncbi:MAG: hypothetical protein UV05_C0014G0003 [candidate division CPR1 bacterium GW2011_GWA2_42_17]|uniref:Uncharacterized protein n=1 Tax=candidate division CPR1 bacterium GW2011_GWA2_42_17 TaxID=1618341 RepID=A0A0G1C2X7_9BACT|nr:MAG: hypothetical protein UV05_C0014G0003 [candidate division CPR1 bacterium GW2011_GWA2_42_17]